ncbi:hypothetical protein FOMPIDRAFT_90767 [Fomitopsis schrenkii]|uniref:Fungal-type protein kinase domain-containing protein n=1 Tax=Fomitopsis schrenkii TaxID=2126942 RepID=S8FF95_FOMSC|nr:hypothetical protein FOMPIDRAFT_90767 [Fomitopsis schrenkii]
MLVDGHGILIDFDNAIVRSTHDVIPQDPLTGTLPFVSAELLTQEYYFDDDDNKGAVRVIPLHDFIHDLESLCWVLVWICVARDGPARRRRDMHSKEDTWELNKLRRDIKTLFEDSHTTMAIAKQAVMLQVAFQKPPLVGHVSEFFSPLKPLITDFLRILVKAYQEHSTDSGAIYKLVFEAFDRCIARLKAHPVALSEVHKSLQHEDDTEESRSGSQLGPVATDGEDFALASKG